MRPAPSTTPNSTGDLSERDLIGRIQARLPPPPGWLIVPIGDDAAVVEPERNRLEVLSVDALVEGVHFDRRFTPPEAIGHRALAVNLSDLAAMGALPRLALLSMVLPQSMALSDFDGIVAGLTALAARCRVHVAGGNITRSPGPLMIDVTVTGTVKRRQALTRRGAKPGDELYVSGSVGAAAAGLGMLRAASASGQVGSPPDGTPPNRYLFPEPRLRLGLLLARNRAASACIDLSDGVAEGIRQLAEASGIGATIDADALPIDQAARDWLVAQGQDPVAAALTGGDDYELLFAVRPRHRSRLAAAIKHGEVTLTRIGVCTEGDSLVLRRGVSGIATDELLPAPAFSHFK